jgi:hypothetical protein
MSQAECRASHACDTLPTVRSMPRASHPPQLFVTNKRRYIWVGAVTSFGVISTMLLAWYGWGTPILEGQSWPDVKVAQVVMLIAWTVMPPTWFWYEYWFIYLKDYHSDETAPENFELFKYGQDLSAKIWLAIVSSTFVIFFWKDIHLFAK